MSIVYRSIKLTASMPSAENSKSNNDHGKPKVNKISRCQTDLSSFDAQCRIINIRSKCSLHEVN